MLQLIHAFPDSDLSTSRVRLQELAHGLGELLSYEGNVEEDFYLTFQVKLFF